MKEIQVVCVTFTHELWDLLFKVVFERQVIFINFQTFCQKSIGRKSPKERFFLSFFLLKMSSLWFELRPYIFVSKPTRRKPQHFLDNQRPPFFWIHLIFPQMVSSKALGLSKKRILFIRHFNRLKFWFNWNLIFKVHLYHYSFIIFFFSSIIFW